VKAYYNMNFGRITASTIHEAAHCQTKDGCLKKLLGASKKFDTKEMKRSRSLEKDVRSRKIKEIETKINKKLMKCSFIIPDFPIFGVDAIEDEFVLEVKYL